MAWSCFTGHALAVAASAPGIQDDTQQPTRFTEPSRFVVPDTTRAIDSSASASGAVPRNQLRWRTSNEVAENSLRPSASTAEVRVAAEAIQPASYEMPADQITQLNAPQQDDPSGSALRYRSSNRSTRSTTEGASLAPIHDPFGDQQAPAANPYTRAQGPSGSNAWQSTSPATTVVTPQWQSSASPQLNSSPQRASSPQQNSSSRPAQLASPTMPTMQSASYYQDAKPFMEISPPDEARDILRDVPLSGINLNVTPWYGSEARTFEQEQAALATLRQNQRSAGPRVWRDRLGNPITEGYLTDFENRMVDIDEGNGQIVQVLVDELSQEDRDFLYSTWELPRDVQVIASQMPARVWVPQTVTWKASALCHKPLYFEDIQLERYGHSAGPFLQPVKSTAHFFGNMLVLPYNTGIHPVNECQYALGYYRPGDCAPWLIDPIPFSLDGALRQAAIVTGAAITIP